MGMITMDLLDERSPVPKRGDRLQTSKSTYYVLHCRPIRQRDHHSGNRRFRIFIMNIDDLTLGTRAKLLTSAMRRGGSFLYAFKWYSRRKKKFASFEELMNNEYIELNERIM